LATAFLKSKTSNEFREIVNRFAQPILERWTKNIQSKV